MVRVRIILLCVAAFSSGQQSCSADLFAAMTNNGGILRIDFDAKQVLKVYPVDDLEFPRTPLAGLTFDGELAYFGQSLPGAETMITPLEVVTGDWLPPVLVEPLVGPIGQPLRVSGLGYLDDGQNPPLMIAALWQSPNTPAAQFTHFEFDPFLGIVPTSPVPVSLDPTFVANGADVDPSTGEIWFAGALQGAALDSATLLQLDLDGNELRRLSPDLGISNVRGIAFDDGRMFVGIRDIANTSNQIVELNPMTGAILNSFTIPAEHVGIMAGLAGGSVVPEPATLIMLVGVAVVHVLRRQSLRNVRCTWM